MPAVISKDRKYRYSLTREWDEGFDTCLFVMLNPSTADADLDDPTIRRCIRFAKDWGYRKLEVVNLYAFRSTDPKQLWQVFDPVGLENDHHIRTASARAAMTIVAWGTNAKKPRQREVLRMLTDPHALEVTKLNFPKHPLYIRADAEPFSIMPAPASAHELRL